MAEEHRAKEEWIVKESKFPLTITWKVARYTAVGAAVIALLFVVGSWILPSGISPSQRQALQNQQVSVKPLDHRLVYLDGVRRVINPTLQQVRTGVESEGCILVYNRAGRFVGKSCAGANETISGLGYSAKTESGIRMMVFLTVCPLGSPGFNSGSCN